jgi:hypothetical protein
MRANGVDRVLLFRLKTECARIVSTARGGLVPNPIFAGHS